LALDYHQHQSFYPFREDNNSYLRELLELERELLLLLLLPRLVLLDELLRLLLEELLRLLLDTELLRLLLPLDELLRLLLDTELLRLLLEELEAELLLPDTRFLLADAFDVRELEEELALLREVFAAPVRDELVARFTEVLRLLDVLRLLAVLFAESLRVDSVRTGVADVTAVR
jgi:hypothetical protein